MLHRRDRNRGGLELPSICEAFERKRGRCEEERPPRCVQGGEVGNLGKRGKLTASMEDEQQGLGHKSCSQTEEKRIIAHGGSSSPGLYISRTGVAGAPYSGQKHPGRPASPKGAVCVGRR